MIDIFCVLGTRPELVKLAPVVAAFRKRGLQVHVALTGQHADLLDIATLGRVGHVEALGVKSDGNVTAFTYRAQRAITASLKRWQPRAVMVQGDTMSAYAGALAAAALGVPIAHVEAGVRSGNMTDPWPEEAIRVAITRMATWHYAATMQAVTNISKERAGAPNVAVVLTGNPGIDALWATEVTARLESSPTVLVTLHRRELRDRADVLDVLQVLANTVSESHVKALWPVHPAMQPLVAKLRLPPNFTVQLPLPYDAMIHALAEARGVLTDSGGLVEEAATLGVPTVVLRNVTDRPEAEAEGIAQRFTPTPDGVAAAWTVLATCAIPRQPTDVYGDGHAAEYIAHHMAKVLKSV